MSVFVYDVKTYNSTMGKRRINNYVQAFRKEKYDNKIPWGTMA